MDRIQTYCFSDFSQGGGIHTRYNIQVGIPNSIITDLGSNFTSSEFFDFCEQWSIQIKYASVAHPRANSQVERANGMILEALRKKVFDKNEKFAGKWIRELPYVVWSLRTQPS
jgi:transposase InsO family protein